MVLPVLVINRAVDTDRLSQFVTSAEARDIQPLRIDAADAHQPDFPFALHADLLRDRFWGSDSIKPGAIGCFLSHRRAWQHVVDNDLPMALVCEDDAEFLSDTDPLTRIATALPGFDVIFANERMAAWCRSVGDYDLKPIPRAVSDLAQAGGPRVLGLKHTPGADCYLISRAGAATLLERTADQGILCGVDWAILWNGIGAVDEQIQQALPELGVLSQNSLAPEPLKMFVVANPVADQRQGVSVLRHSVSVPIADLMHRESMLAHVDAVSTLSLGATKLCFACRSGPDPVMEAHRSGQIWDEAGLTALLKRFPNGGTFVDIGAHSGNHAVVIARLGGASRIVAIEPNAEVHRILQTNMAINGVADRLDLRLGIALSGKLGTGYLIRNRKRSSETMVKAELPSDADTRAEAVELVTGDALLSSEEIDAIKIDTSGSEVDVVKGLKRTLKAQRPMVLMDHATQSLERIDRLSEEIGYHIAETHPAGRRNRSSSLLIPRPDAGQ